MSLLSKEEIAGLSLVKSSFDVLDRMIREGKIIETFDDPTSFDYVVLGWRDEKGNLQKEKIAFSKPIIQKLYSNGELEYMKQIGVSRWNIMRRIMQEVS
jgi:hypothetical protein